jgi:uncharacterized protein YbjT (DUF2867 family)
LNKVLLFGASGNLGKEIAKEVKQQSYDLTVVVRNKNKAEHLTNVTSKYIITYITKQTELTNICNGYDIVISSLGKSVSPNDKSKASFYDIDFISNSFILEEAKRSGIKKFVYVSALHSEKFQHLEYFKVHHDFSEKLRLSGINYSIIKPTAFFSAFIDLIEMAKKGRLINIMPGDKRTNPVYEGDLAKICVDSIKENNIIIEAGGKKIYTRKELNEIIQKEVNPSGKLKNIPISVLKFSLPTIKMFNKNLYAKLAFFIEVIQHDLIAPPIGQMKFKDYIKIKAS